MKPKARSTRDHITQLIPALGWRLHVQDVNVKSAHFHYDVMCWALTASGEVRAIYSPAGKLEFTDPPAKDDVHTFTYDPPAKPFES